MKVRLLMPWGTWSKGHVFPEMPGGQARTLIARGVAEEVRDDPQPPPGTYADRQMLAERGSLRAAPARARRRPGAAAP